MPTRAWQGHGSSLFRTWVRTVPFFVFYLRTVHCSVTRELETVSAPPYIATGLSSEPQSLSLDTGHCSTWLCWLTLAKWGFLPWLKPLQQPAASASPGPGNSHWHDITHNSASWLLTQKIIGVNKETNFVSYIAFIIDKMCETLNYSVLHINHLLNIKDLWDIVMH